MPLSKRNVMRAGYRFVAFLTVNKGKLAAVLVFTALVFTDFVSDHCSLLESTAYLTRECTLRTLKVSL